MKNEIFSIILIFIFLNPIYNLLCGEEEIENCHKCGTGENFETCNECEDKYFPFMNNVLCLPCDHPLYGMYGCGGKCDGSNYLSTRNVLCEENGCKEGYYFLQGFCIPCSFATPNCGKCTYTPPPGTISNETLLNHFTCTDCINNQYILQNERCYHCYIKRCDICHYESYNKVVCDKCENGYYVNSKKTCSSCYSVDIFGGRCYVCSDNRMEYQSCYCSSFFTEISKGKWISCPSNCAHCNYNSLENKFTCYRCGTGYTLNNLGVCVSCGFNCDVCYLDVNQNPICTSCHIGYTLNEDRNCLNCPENCQSCKLEHNSELVCTSCYREYGLNPEKRCSHCPENCHYCFWKQENGKFGCSHCYKDGKYSHQNNYIEGKDDICIRCQDIEEIGGPGCIQCSFNRNNDQNYKCHRCLGDTRGYYPSIYDPIKNYAFVENKYQCLTNLQRLPSYLHGCIDAKYNSIKDIYECRTCKPNSEFIPVYNEKSCRIPSEIGLSSNCYSAERIGEDEQNPNYSCLNCHTVSITDHLGKVDCYDAINELVLCSKGIKDENGKFQCTECQHNFQFIFSSDYNQNICDNKCDTESFYKWNWCYKCDDQNVGNPGCEREVGCSYSYSNDELDCHQCKESYFKYTQGQCFSCSKENIGCAKCHLDEINKRFICDECSNGYSMNTNTEKCEIIICDEYPDITKGCTICSNNTKEYISQKKCQGCLQGFFKTKDESCIYCKARKNGGPGCELCEYLKNENGEETDEIRCQYCPPGSALSSDKKCYNCQEELGEACMSCKFIKNEENNTEQLKCQSCKYNYHLSPNGYCIHYQSYYPIIPHCAYSIYNVIINNLTYNISNYNNESYYDEIYDSTMINNEYGNYSLYNNSNEGNQSSNNFTIKATCQECKSGYYKTREGKCEKIDIELCSYFSILETGEYSKYLSCKNFCQNKDYTLIYYYLDDILDQLIDNDSYYNNDSYHSSDLWNEDYLSDSDTYNDYYTEYSYSNNNSNKSLDDMNQGRRKLKFNFESIINKYGISKNTIYSLSENLKSIIVNGYFCLGNSGNGDKNQPINLKKCKNSEYIEENDTYKCLECIAGYSLDKDTNICKQSIKISMNLHPGLSNCYVENIGSNSNPLYSCKYCYHVYDLLITTESGAKFCETPLDYNYPWIESPNYELEGCTEANADTTYINNNYNCTNCSIGYISYYSRFLKRKICQNVYDKIIRTKDQFDSNIFNDVESVEAKDGKCENNKLFTPDNNKCYACNNKQVGMVGCKGTCTFSIKRNNVIECEEGGCKTGYLEKTKGVCEPCDTVNKGCIECHYDNNYLNDYSGLKRKRRFVCDQCEEGYLKSEDGTCHNCTELGFKNCDKCKREESNDNDIVCYQCSEGYFLTIYGECTKCKDNQVRGNGNICINCDDVEDGGIEGCSSCFNENEQILCQQCKSGFILLENNKTCLKISNNSKLEEFTNCNQLYLNNDNKLVCINCNKNYNILRENDEIKCLSSKFFPTANPNNNWLCKEFINLGTEDKPKYSCINCIDFQSGEYYFEEEENSNNYNYSNYDYWRVYDLCKYACHQKWYDGIFFYEYIDICMTDCIYQKANKTKKSVLTKLTFTDNNTAYCDYSKKYETLENCTEGKITKEGDILKINCTKCSENNTLKYHEDTNSYICKYVHYEKNCVAKYCKTCRKDNNYFCESCLPTDYEVNPITGVCVKKTEKVPAVTWKDIFRLQMNQQKTINGREVYGPSFVLRGLTNSQINTGHAFLIYMIFKIEYTRNIRILEEEKKVPTICEVIDSVDETDDEANIVEYDCIGNLTEDENEELSDYKLNNITEGDDSNEGVLGNSNLNDLVEETDFDNLDKKNKSTYNLGNLLETSIFSLNKIENQTSENLEFSFTLNGKLSKNLEPSKIEAKLALSEIKDKKADCIFDIKENKNADLSCTLNIEDYKNYKYFSFKITEIGDENKSIYLNKINEIYLINEFKENNEEKNNNYTILIVAILCSVVGIFCIAIIIILLIRRQRKNKAIINKVNEDSKSIKGKSENENDYSCKRIQYKDEVKKEK